MITKEIFYQNLENNIEKLNPQLDFSGPNLVSSILLYKDFIRRMHIWKEELEIKMDRYNYETFNLFIDIDPNWSSELEPWENYWNYITTNYANWNGRNLNYLFLYLYTYWNLYNETSEIKKFSHLENPYDSVTKIIANKNMVFKYHDIEVSGVGIRNKYKDFKLPSIDDNFLI